MNKNSVTETDLVRKIQLLKEIKPRKNWVSLTKSQILGDYETQQHSVWEVFQWIFQYRPVYKPVFVSLVTLTVLIGTFGFAQNSLPGDILYPIKKITERSQALFVSESELPGYNLEMANRRLEELTEIAETNQVKKLAPALSEFQASVLEAAQNLVKIKEPEKAHEAGKVVVVEIKKLEENKQKIESFGVVVGDAEEIENAMCLLVEREIQDLGTLSERQGELLKEAEEYLKEGKCSLAFEKILLLGYSPR